MTDPTSVAGGGPNCIVGTGMNRAVAVSGKAGSGTSAERVTVRSVIDTDFTVATATTAFKPLNNITRCPSRTRAKS